MIKLIVGLRGSGKTKTLVDTISCSTTVPITQMHFWMLLRLMEYAVKYWAKEILSLQFHS